MKTLALAGVALLLVSLFAAPAQSQDVQSVSLPSLSWALEFSAPGFAVTRNEIQQDGRRYFLAENKQIGITVSVFLEAAHSKPGPDECKRSLEQRVTKFSSLTTGGLKGVAYRQSGDALVLEYMLPEVDGVPVNQKNLFACIPRDDAYIDFHISKVHFHEADRAQFDAILQSIHFVAHQASAVPSGNSMALLQEGASYFQAHQFAEAVGPLQKALDIEKVSPSLDKRFFRVLVDLLTISYAESHNLRAAEGTANYGISKDPDYPIYYYNLACSAAEKNDVPNTKKLLKMAMDRRTNLLQGESLPDARTDDSFQKLLQDPGFKAYLDNLYSANPT
jgi:tetratricopeptide (TPR) repeat protein